jgi:hypothetical protein
MGALKTSRGRLADDCIRLGSLLPHSVDGSFEAITRPAAT